MLRTASAMRKHKLAKVEDLLTNQEALESMALNQAGMDLLHDLRKFTAKSLENMAPEVDRQQVKKSFAH